MSFVAAHRFWFYLAGTTAGYVWLMCSNPVHAAFGDGLRCVRRYGKIWRILALFGFTYALFHLALRVFYYFALSDSERPGFLWSFTWAFPPASHQFAEVHTLGDWWTVLKADPRSLLLKESALNALESVAGLFNNSITTFPFSALAALLLLGNWENHHATLRRTLWRRFGRLGALPYAGILLCALAAVLKPVLFGPSLPVLNRFAPGLLLLRWSSLIDWLSFLFEYLFGVCIQIYLILMVYAWVRGLTFTPVHLLDFAIRRFSFVVKWAALVMLVSALFIDLPRVYALMFHFDDSPFITNTILYIDWIARPLLAVFLLLFASVQITLTFHSESLRKALRDHAALLRRHAWDLGWFLIIAAIHFFLLSFLNQGVVRGFGEESVAALAWSLIFPLLGALVTAWLLATWVCVFRRCETDRQRAENRIKI